MTPVAEERVERRLAAILAADVAGYSRLMGEDEAGTRSRFNTHLHELIEPASVICEVSALAWPAFMIETEAVAVLP